MKSKKNYKKVATIDIGSNGIRMLISNLYKIKGKYFHTKNTLHPSSYKARSRCIYQW